MILIGNQNWMPLVILYLFLWDKVSVCNPGWPYTDRDLHPFAFWVLGLESPCPAHHLYFKCKPVRYVGFAKYKECSEIAHRLRPKSRIHTGLSLFWIADKTTLKWLDVLPIHCVTSYHWTNFCEALPIAWSCILFSKETKPSFQCKLRSVGTGY